MSVTLSDCCGAETKVEYRSDHPFYDDAYDLIVRVVVCMSCGKAVGLDPPRPRPDTDRERS